MFDIERDSFVCSTLSSPLRELALSAGVFSIDGETGTDTRSLLPSVMVASYIKRLSRLTMTAPPAGIILVIPFLYNLLKRHPACMVMIQRPDSEADENGDEYKGKLECYEIPYLGADALPDPYRADDPSPFTSNAIASSCWELFALQNHYLASVSTLAKVFNEVFTKPEYNMEDFLDHGYGTVS